MSMTPPGSPIHNNWGFETPPGGTNLANHIFPPLSPQGNGNVAANTPQHFEIIHNILFPHFDPQELQTQSPATPTYATLLTNMEVADSTSPSGRTTSDYDNDVAIGSELNVERRSLHLIIDEFVVTHFASNENNTDQADIFEQNLAALKARQDEAIEESNKRRRT